MLNQTVVNELRKLLPQCIGEINSPIWVASKRIFAPAGRLRNPLLTIKPQTIKDVQIALKFLNDQKLRFSVRSGGHSFDGFCLQNDKVLLDLSALKSRNFDEHTKLLRAMPGVTNSDVIETCVAHGAYIPCGDCPTVALGGLIGGGGFGYISREHGLAIDLLVEVKLVNLNGEILVANKEKNRDLFWAVRGGAGAVGVIVEMTFKTVPINAITLISLNWNWQQADKALILFSELLKDSPSALDIKLKIRTTGNDRFFDNNSSGPPGHHPGEPHIQIDGQFLGSEEEAGKLLEPLLTEKAATNKLVKRVSGLEAFQKLIPLEILSEPAPENIKSLRVASDFGKDCIDYAEAASIVQFINALQNDEDLLGGAVLIEGSNGQICRNKSADSTAFPHRDADFLYQWILFDKIPSSSTLVERHNSLLGKIRDDLSHKLTGGRYINYADRLDSSKNWWGSNLEYLEKIASRYDPERLIISRLYP